MRHDRAERLLLWKSESWLKTPFIGHVGNLQYNYGKCQRKDEFKREVRNLLLLLGQYAILKLISCLSLHTKPSCFSSLYFCFIFLSSLTTLEQVDEIRSSIGKNVDHFLLVLHLKLGETEILQPSWLTVCLAVRHFVTLSESGLRLGLSILVVLSVQASSCSFVSRLII